MKIKRKIEKGNNLNRLKEKEGESGTKGKGKEMGRKKKEIGRVKVHSFG